MCMIWVWNIWEVARDTCAAIFVVSLSFLQKKRREDPQYGMRTPGCVKMGLKKNAVKNVYNPQLSIQRARMMIWDIRLLLFLWWVRGTVLDEQVLLILFPLRDRIWPQCVCAYICYTHIHHATRVIYGVQDIVDWDGCTTARWVNVEPIHTVCTNMDIMLLLQRWVMFWSHSHTIFILYKYMCVCVAHTTRPSWMCSCTPTATYMATSHTSLSLCLEPKKSAIACVSFDFFRVK